MFYTITFDANGGTCSTSEFTGIQGTQYSLPSAEHPSGLYFFTGWRDQDGNLYSAGENYTLVATLTLTAEWVLIINSVTFELDGGSGDFPTLDGTPEMNIIISDTVPVKAGFTFVKWVNSSGIEFYPGDAYFFIYGVDTLTAVWEVAIYTVAFDNNGGSGDIPSISGQENTNIILPSETPVKDGFTFIRWVGTNGTTYAPGSPYFFMLPTETLTAVWGYTVTIFADGGDCPDSVSGAIDEELELIPTKENYTFLYWLKSDENEALQFNADNPYTFSYGNDHLCAVWGKAVTYDLNGGSGSFPTQVTDIYGPVTVHSGSPTKSDLIFEYWEDSDGNVYYGGDNYNGSVNVTLIAKWTAGVVFNYNGGSGNYTVITMPEGHQLELGCDNPVKAGYQLEKWVDSFGNEYAPDGIYPMLYGYDVLTAIWKCTLTLDFDGGSGSVSSYTQTEGSSVSLPVTIKEGYNFVKWVGSDGTEYSDSFTFDHGDDTLTAVWEIKAYPVTYDLDGGTGDFAAQLKYHFSEYTIYSEIPVKEGYTFHNWESEGIYYEPSDSYIGNAPLSLKAIWVAEGENVITYNILDAGASVVQLQRKAENESVTIAQSSSYYENFAIYRWIDEDGNAYYPGDIYSGSSSLKLTAEWRAIYDVILLSQDNTAFASLRKFHDVDLVIPESVPDTWFDSSKQCYCTLSHWENTSNKYIYLPGSSISENECIDLQPQWQNTYVLRFIDSDGEEMPVGDDNAHWQEKEEGVTVNLTKETPYKEGYEFVCWKCRADGKYYMPGEAYSADASSAFDAIVEEVGKVSVIYDVGDTDSSEEDFPKQTVNVGDFVTIHSTIPVKSGYTFTGWSIKDSEAELQTASLLSRSVSSNAASIAPSEELNTDTTKILLPNLNKNYTVSFYSENVKIAEYQTYNMCDYTIPNIEIEKSGSYLVCWKVKNQGTYCREGDSYLIKRNTTFEAVWVEDGNTTVLYDTKGGNTSISNILQSRNSTFEVSDITPEHISGIFEGWQIRGSYGNMIGRGDSIRVLNPIILDAQWTDLAEAVIAIDNLPIGNRVYIRNNHTLKAKIYLSAPCIITWSSSNTDIATIDQSGDITPLQIGETDITLTVTSANNPDTKYSVTETIKIYVPYFHSYDNKDNIFTMLAGGHEYNSLTQAKQDEIKSTYNKILILMNDYYLNNEAVSEHIRNSSSKTCIFAFEGLGDPDLKADDSTTNNVSEIHPYWLYNAMMVVTKGSIIKYITRRASTFPDKNTNFATILEDVYDYSTGMHQGTYVALKMHSTENPRAYYRENGSFYERKCDGINIHAGFYKFYTNEGDNNSEGCQIIHYKDYVDFGKKVGFLEDDSNLGVIPDIQTNFNNNVGNHINDYKKDVSIKYILDRTYDNTNNFYADTERLSAYWAEREELSAISESELTATQESRLDELNRWYNYYTNHENDYANGIFYPLTTE